MKSPLLVVHLLLHAASLKLSLAGSYPECHLCTGGKHLTNPNTVVLEGATCDEINAMGRARRYSSFRCGFLSGYLEERCCGTTEQQQEQQATLPANYNNHATETNTTSGYTQKAHLTDSSVLSTTCYTIVDTNERLCMEDLPGIGFCFATLNDRVCSSCTQRDFGLCGPYQTQGGHAIDCSAARPKYKEMRICGNDLFLESPSSTHYSSRSRSSSGNGSLSGMVVPLVFVFFVIAKVAARAGMSEDRGQLHQFQRVTVELSQVGSDESAQEEGPVAEAVLVAHHPIT